MTDADIMKQVNRLIEIEEKRRALQEETVEIVRAVNKHLTPVGRGQIVCLSFMPLTKMGDNKRRQAREYFDREYGQINTLPGMNQSPPVNKLPGM